MRMIMKSGCYTRIVPKDEANHPFSELFSMGIDGVAGEPGVAMVLGEYAISRRFRDFEWHSMRKINSSFYTY